MYATILQPDQSSLDLVAGVLLRGEAVAMPTETVYGLAANALNPEAVSTIFTIKERPTFDPLIVHIASSETTLLILAEKGLVNDANMSEAGKATFKTLTEKFWPGPLTVVLPRGDRIPLLVTSGLDGVALRCPSHPVFQSILQRTGFPLAAPSANRFGRISPTSASAVKDELGSRIKFIVDGGSCKFGVESTVVSLNNDGSISLLRPGGLPLEQLVAEFGADVAQGTSSQQKQSPGHTAQHYAPRKSLFRMEDSLLTLDQAINHLAAKGFNNLTVIGWEESPQIMTSFQVNWLKCGTSDGSGAAAARDFFATLRAADANSSDGILVLPLPAKGNLWLAIDDRLKRAKSDWPSK